MSSVGSLRSSLVLPLSVNKLTCKNDITKEHKLFYRSNYYKRDKGLHKNTYISIFRNVNQLIISTVDMRNLKHNNSNKTKSQMGTWKKQAINESDQRSFFTYITIVGRRNNVFKFLAGEDIYSYKMTFSMTMLASLWRWNLNNLKHNISFYISTIYQSLPVVNENIRSQTTISMQEP